MKYFTSDLHFGYEPILKQANRPFESIEQMNKAIIDNFNSVLTKDDVLVILGDVACYGYNPKNELKAINGKKVLIVGNHDKEPLKHKSFRDCFIDIRDNEIDRSGDISVFLSHYPMAEWDGYFKGIWHFYGHVHNSSQGAGSLMKLFPRAVNVGVDVNGFMPKTKQQLIAEREKEYDPTKLGVSEEFLKRNIFVEVEDRAVTRR